MPFLIDNLDINNDRVVFSDRILKVLPSSFQTDLNIIDCIVNSSSTMSATIATSCMIPSHGKNQYNNKNEYMSFADVTKAMQADKNLNLIIYKQRVYSIKLWLPKHPGGDLVITHMIGEDATTQILAFHSNTKQVERIMEKYLYANLIDDDDSNNADDKANNNSDKADDKNDDDTNNVDYNNNDKCNNDKEEVVVVNKMQKQQQQQQQRENDRLVKSFDSLKDTVSRLGLMETSYQFYYMRGFQYLLQFIGSIFICFYTTSYFNSILGGISIGMVRVNLR